MEIVHTLMNQHLSANALMDFTREIRHAVPAILSFKNVICVIMSTDKPQVSSWMMEVLFNVLTAATENISIPQNINAKIAPLNSLVVAYVEQLDQHVQNVFQST